MYAPGLCGGELFGISLDLFIEPRYLLVGVSGLLDGWGQFFALFIPRFGLSFHESPSG